MPEKQRHREAMESLASRRRLLLLAGLLLTLFVIGSAFDHDISLALYAPANWFGITGAAFGELPSGLAMLAAGVLLIRWRNRQRTAVGVAQAIGGGLLYLLGAVLVIAMPTRYLEWNGALVVTLGVVLVAAATLATLYLAGTADPRTALKVATVLAVVVVVEIIVVNVLKVGWDRPRMRMITEVGNVAFDPWWSPGNPDKELLLANGVAAEEFKSFPSGHVGNAATLLLLMLAPLLRPTLKPWAALIFWGATLWAAFVALSRIIMGAHFLTDTVVGWTVTVTVILLTHHLVFRPRSAKAKAITPEGTKDSHALS